MAADVSGAARHKDMLFMVRHIFLLTHALRQRRYTLYDFELPTYPEDSLHCRARYQENREIPLRVMLLIFTRDLEFTLASVCPDLQRQDPLPLCSGIRFAAGIWTSV